METLDSAVGYLRSYLQGKESFRLACRWDGSYVIDPFGNVRQKLGENDVGPPETQLPPYISKLAVLEWVAVAHHEMALHRLEGKPFPKELEQARLERMAGV